MHRFYNKAAFVKNTGKLRRIWTQSRIKLLSHSNFLLDTEATVIYGNYKDTKHLSIVLSRALKHSPLTYGYSARIDSQYFLVTSSDTNNIFQHLMLSALNGKRCGIRKIINQGKHWILPSAKETKSKQLHPSHYWNACLALHPTSVKAIPVLRFVSQHEP